MGREWVDREVWACGINVYLNLKPVLTRYACMVEISPMCPSWNKTYLLYNLHCHVLILQFTDLLKFACTFQNKKPQFGESFLNKCSSQITVQHLFKVIFPTSSFFCQFLSICSKMRTYSSSQLFCCILLISFK